MGKTPEELLKVRYKVIADYPGSSRDWPEGMKVDRILSPQNVGWAKNVLLWNPDDFPHLFKRLEWWEDRAKEDMPEYFKKKFLSKESKKEGWIVEKIDGEFFIIEEWAASGFVELLPATESEYLAFKTPTP